MTDRKNISLEERDLRYAGRLAEMIRCRTVSKKDGFEADEFLKLRQVIAALSHDDGKSRAYDLL